MVQESLDAAIKHARSTFRDMYGAYAEGQEPETPAGLDV